MLDTGARLCCSVRQRRPQIQALGGQGRPVVITIREVAKESGFSSTTVSIVLNNAPLALKLRNYIPTTIESQRKPTVNKIREWLQTICTKCGYSIAPIDLVR